MAVVAVVAGCAHHQGPTFAGADLYAQVQVLQDKGHATVPASPHPVEVRTGQILVSVDGGSQYEIDPLIARCHGGDPGHDNECMLAQLRGQRFRVTKAVPEGKPPHADAGGKMSFRAKALIVALVIGAPLTYGLAKCGFAGCHAVFGVPLVLDAGFLTLATLGPD